MLILPGFFFATSPFMYLLVKNGIILALIRVYHDIATAVFTPVSLVVIADVYAKVRGGKNGYILICYTDR